MPSNAIAKIKSARSLAIWALVLIPFVALLVAIPFLLRDSGQKPLVTDSRPAYQLTVGGPQAGEQAGMVPRPKGKAYYLQAATSQSALEKGLGGTPSLGVDQGMVFLYANVSERCFWMKAMRYDLDILWLDDAKKIVAIERDVLPSTYPKTFCHTAQYVIELNAGETAKSGLEQGQVLNF